VSVTPASRTVKNVNIWTKKLRTIMVKGAFKGINSPGRPLDVRIVCSDGISKPILMSTEYCDESNPAYFIIPDVAFPEKQAQYTITLSDTVGGVGNAVICLDGKSNTNVDPLILGYNCKTPPLPHYGSAGCYLCCPYVKADYECNQALPSPIDLAGGYTNATARILITEYYDQNGSQPFSSTTTGRIKMVNKTTGDTIIQTPSPGGTAFFSVPVVEAQQIEFTAYMTTTGYTGDTFFLPFAVMPGAKYDLEECVSCVGLPPGDSRHTFVMKRVSAICGTVWAVTGTKGYASAQVSVYNEGTKWQTVVVTDGSGRFYAPDVPQEKSEVYRVAPMTGADLTSDPLSYHVAVTANGLDIHNGTEGPLEFTLNAINGIIKGVITLNGKPVPTGATVIASTYDHTGFNTFVDSFPNAALNGQYTYSAVTMTDGTYRLKVATGITDATGALIPYFIYVGAKIDVNQYVKKVSAGVVVPSVPVDVPVELQ